MGQIMDMCATARKPGEKIDFSRFTMDRMSNIMKHKTGYYTFVLPVQAAMHFVSSTALFCSCFFCYLYTFSMIL